jgi:PAS domain S-box-containing protein
MTINPRRILIIEDDPDGRAELRKMILSGSDRRYEFSEAELGATALKQVQENANTPFDCILLEYHLPDLDAQEMLVAICDGRDLPPSPIVVLTGSDRDVGRELLRGGAQDYLGKGWITPESLTRAIENAIDRFAMLTDQRKNEVALRESDEKFRSLLESAPDAMVIADPSGQIVLVNAATLRMFGYTRSDLIGERVEMLIPSSARERHVHLRMDFTARPITRTMGKGQPLTALRKDGSEFPVEIALSPIALESGTLISSSIRDISDRVKNAKAIEESESRLMLGVEVAGLALAEVDYTTGLNHLTKDAARLFGLAQDFLVVPRETVHAAFHPDDHDELMVRIADSLSPSGRGWFAMDHRVLWPNGEVHWLRVRKQVYFEGDGDNRHPLRAVLALFDVTAEKNAAEIVRASGEFVRGVLDSLPEHVVVLDNLGTVLAVNQPSDRHTTENGATLSTATIGINYLDLCRQSIAKGGPDVHGMIDGLEEVLNGTRSDFETEYPCLTPGREEWFSMHAQRMRSENAGVILSHINITDSRVAQRRLEDSETRFRRLFEAAHDGILILDASTQKITHVNPFLTTLLDYPAEYFLDKELWEIGFLKDKQASVLAMEQLDKIGSIRYEGLPLEDRHGQKHPVEMVANKYEEGLHPVIQCNIRDIAERRKLEKQMLSQAAELSDLHRRKDEFLAMLSHELRSPLAPIANAVQLLGLPNGVESMLQRQARGIIERQVGQLQHLVDDLLEVSRITTGRVQLRQERVAIRGIVDGAIETARPLIDQRKHELSISLPQETLWLNADAARLEQVVVNLLTNAAKYTEEKGHISLSVQAEGDECVLRVRDTGVGIAPALLPKIFDLFTQAERSLDRSQGGLGIGLALVQRLTELHGGRVEVHSSLGQGSEFVVRIPLMSIELTNTPPPSEVEDPTVVRPLRVLVVDDNVDTVLSFSILLRASGHDVFTANDGLIAVQVANEQHPDVVLLDIGLPGLNGYDVAKRIRKQTGGNEIVLIALTGYGQDTDRELSAQAGFNHHLVKPARLEQVKEILAAAAEKRIHNTNKER